MYDFIEKMLGITGDGGNVIVMSDFNAVIDEVMDSRTVDKHGLGIRNNRDERLVSFSKENNLLVINTMFELPKRRRSHG